jgi:hypothetical protein
MTATIELTGEVVHAGHSGDATVRGAFPCDAWSQHYKGLGGERFQRIAT